MKDIVRIEDGEDLTVRDSLAPKAANVISVQIGSLEYLPEFGVDMAYFLQPDFQFQNASFKAYLINRLIQNQVNVSQVIEVINTLYGRLIWFVGESQGGVLDPTTLVEFYNLLDTDATPLTTEADEELLIKF